MGTAKVFLVWCLCLNLGLCSGQIYCPISGIQVPSRYNRPSTESPTTLFYYGSYSFFNRKSFYKAYLDCRSDGGHLASMKSTTQFDDVSAIRSTLGGDAWVGLLNEDLVTCEDATCNGLIAWADGSSFTMDDYASPVPLVEFNNNNYAVKMKSSGELDDTWPGGGKRYICQFDCDNIHSPPTTCGNGATIPNDFHEINGKYYRIPEQFGAFSYASGLNECNELGASLATFKSQADYEAVMLLVKQTDDEMWVDLIKPDASVACTTIADCSVNGVLRWGDGETFVDPDPTWTIDHGIKSDAGQSCHRMKKDFEIEDKACHFLNDIVCQFKCPTACPVPEAVVAPLAARSWSSGDSTLEGVSVT